eukprot:TRINITY_DN1730_c0_g1_i2.p2 TRINITY_DN1730_c0_g1~~TRINITY_DN1730_c0_g1_i2.p2  ORF type:complete len:147 (-),score=42.49 TRINITY_DN1730_c0_g1_i2:92-475(-)
MAQVLLQRAAACLGTLLPPAPGSSSPPAAVDEGGEVSRRGGDGVGEVEETEEYVLIDKRVAPESISMSPSAASRSPSSSLVAMDELLLTPATAAAPATALKLSLPSSSSSSSKGTRRRWLSGKGGKQ